MLYLDTETKRIATDTDGTVVFECDLQPSVLPMTGLMLGLFNKPLYLLALKTRRDGIERGQRYRAEAVWNDGRVMVSKGDTKLPGLYTMDCFAEIVEANHVFPPQPHAGDSISLEATLEPVKPPKAKG